MEPQTRAGLEAAGLEATGLEATIHAIIRTRGFMRRSQLLRIHGSNNV